MKDAETNDKAATVAEQAAHVAPDKASPKKRASSETGGPKGHKTGKGAKTKAGVPKKASKVGTKATKRARKASVPRAESKGAKILEMIARAKGATLAEIMRATEWQAHSVRGFSSTARKKHGVKIESAKNEAGDRLYRVSK